MSSSSFDRRGVPRVPSLWPKPLLVCCAVGLSGRLLPVQSFQGAPAWQATRLACGQDRGSWQGYRQRYVCKRIGLTCAAGSSDYSEGLPPRRRPKQVVDGPAPPVANWDRLVNALSSPSSKQYMVWAAFLGLVYQLRPFYSVILGTFILSYIGNSAITFGHEAGNRLLGRLGLPIKRLPRRLYALAYTLMLMTAITSLTILSVPRLNVESEFLTSLSESDNPYVLLATWMRNSFGPDALNRLEPFLLSITGESGRVFAGYESNYRELIATKLTEATPWNTERNKKFAKLLQYGLSGYIRRALGVCSSIITNLTTVIYKAGLSLLFSFMVVWDLPKLKRGITELKHSRLAFAYDVVAPQVRTFASLVGKSFEVQFTIAIINTILTTAGLYLLGLKGAVVLSLLVFICSFIPVAGVFLSTVPMMLAALSEQGVAAVGQVIMMVLGVHAVEAYMLNPQIYSAKLKLHPVLVLAVLYVTEHIVGVQGLILAVPVAVYITNVIFSNKGPTSKADVQSAATESTMA